MCTYRKHTFNHICTYSGSYNAFICTFTKITWKAYKYPIHAPQQQQQKHEYSQTLHDTPHVLFYNASYVFLYFTVPFRGPPRYNPRRRSGIGWGASLSRLGGPPSPCPSEHPFSSASSSLSEGSSSHRSHEDDISIVTGI